MSDAKQPGGPPDKITFYYIKSPQFRVVHVDGVSGGPTPSGRGIHIAFFSERVAIPQQTTQSVGPDGALGPEIPGTRFGKEGIVRELEVDAILDLDTAKAFQLWLGAVLEKSEQGKET